mmetsp:Transcript_31204/g.71229  ORF Transcript_31204/g.71229 Transcript_31204/m.71229 type:complete len:321 (-) Transcript_31204:217-1179(-)
MLMDFLAPPGSRGRIAEGYLKGQGNATSRSTSPDSQSGMRMQRVQSWSSLSIRTDCGEDWPPQGYVMRNRLSENSPEKQYGCDAYFQDCDVQSCRGNRADPVLESWIAQCEGYAMPSYPNTPPRWPATPSDECLSTLQRTTPSHTFRADARPWEPSFTHRIAASPRPHTAQNYSRGSTMLLPPAAARSVAVPRAPAPSMPAPLMPPSVSANWAPPPPPAHAPVLPASVASPPAYPFVDEQVAAPLGGSSELVLGSAACPTKGSANHGTGSCKPCAFVYKKGCVNGVHCTFCHLCGPQEKKRRQKEKKAMLRELHRQDPEV